VLLPGEAKKAVSAISKLAGYRSVREPHFGTARGSSLALMSPWYVHTK